MKEINVYPVGVTKEIEISGETRYHEKYEDYAFHNYGDFVFQKTTSKNMSKLWKYFYKTENYPEYYFGIAKKIAICKCPKTEKEEWFNADRCLLIENPTKGSTVTIEHHTKDAIYTKDFIFIGWAQTPVHEWRMKNGITLLLEQRFVDGLLPEDKRYLKIRT